MEHFFLNNGGVEIIHNDEHHMEYLPSPQTTLVFHPGSRNLRVGRSTDPAPTTILHGIGRRRKTKAGVNTLRKDDLLPIDGGRDHLKLPPEVESARLQLCHTLQTALKSDGSGRFATPSQTIATLNKAEGDKEGATVCSEGGGGPLGPGWEEFKGVERVVGDDLLNLSPDGDFNIHFPWRRGGLNVHENIGGSLSSVISDLYDIWSWCVTEKLKIRMEDLSEYQAVVIIPVMFEKSHAREVLNMLLNDMGFSAAFLIQDHVCATFGAGLPVATVVDVGDQKISVSCVEDGTSIPQSRLLLKYGGIDLTYSLLHLIQQSSVPFNIDRRSMWDINFVNSMKEKLCHLDLDRCGPEDHQIVWNKPGTRHVGHSTHFGDELLIVPLSYFNPDLLRGSIGSKSVVFYNPPTYIPDDPFGETYINETSKRVKDTDEDDEESDEDKEDIVHQINRNRVDSDTLLGIDQAILQSIDASEADEETKRRLYSCILVIGDGFKFKGLGSWLQNKLSITIPKTYKSDVDVTTQPKGVDPGIVTWKGACILIQLETSLELWISKEEWNTFGFRILREKSLSSF